MNELEKLKDYLDAEYASTARFLTHPIPSWCKDPEEHREKAIVRGLGAVMYAQYLGVPYEEVNEVFEIYKSALEDIIVTKEREIRI